MTDLGFHSHRAGAAPVGPQMTARTRLASAFVLALLASACAGPHPAARVSAAPEAERRIELHDYFRGLKTVEIEFAGVARRFLIDTAGGRSVVTPEFAKTIDCTPTGRDFGYRMDGSVVAFGRCPGLEGRLGGAPIRIAPIAVFDLAQVMPPELPALDGLLALDAFRGRGVTLDWPAHMLTVHAAGDVDQALAQHGLPGRLATGEAGSSLAIVVPVRLDTHLLWFLLGSGDILGTLVAPHAVGSGPAEPGRVLTADLAVGTRSPAQFELLVRDIHYDGVLGTAFLDRGPVTLDLRAADRLAP